MNEAMTELEKAVELLPCPFCGVIPCISRRINHKNDCYLWLAEGGPDPCFVWEDFTTEWNNQFAAKRLKEVEKERDEFKTVVAGYWRLQSELSTLRVAYKKALEFVKRERCVCWGKCPTQVQEGYVCRVCQLLSTPHAIAAMK